MLSRLSGRLKLTTFSSFLVYFAQSVNAKPGPPPLPYWYLVNQQFSVADNHIVMLSWFPLSWSRFTEKRMPPGRSITVSPFSSAPGSYMHYPTFQSPHQIFPFSPSPISIILGLLFCHYPMFLKNRFVM